VAQRREKLARKAAPAVAGEGSAEGETADQQQGGSTTSPATPTKGGKSAPAGRRRGQPASKNNRPSGKAGRSSSR